MTAPAAVVTRYAGLTRAQAALVVALVVLAALWLVRGALSSATPRAAVAAPPGGLGDVALYEAVVARVRAGEGYYTAVGTELRARQYPLKPALNWRQPTYAWLLAGLPSVHVGRAMLVAIGLAVVLLARRWWARSSRGGRATATTAVMAVTMAGCFVWNFVFLQESWAGFFIALSVCLYALDLWPLGLAACLLALAFRELALLPCAVGLALAVRARRWPEVAAWVVGLGLYAALMAWHFSVVQHHLQPGDPSRSWITFGGAKFVLATSQWNGCLMLLPRWGAALLLPLMLLGLGGWRDEGAARAALIVLGYLATFCVLGDTFNDYWGSVYAPLLSFGLLALPACLRDLARVLARPPRSGGDDGRREQQQGGAEVRG